MRRIVLTAMLTSLVACGIDKTKFEPTYRAGKTLQSAVETSVNLIRYTELVQALDAEVSIVRDRASGAKEKELVTLYEEALRSYKDALVIWQLKVEGRADVIFRGPTLDKLLEPYDVTFENDMAPAEATMRKIWPVASARLDRANARLNE
jgi:hypothetical protein